MLESLKVRNFAVVESAEARFAPGLNVLTGETGAGKSVLMGALSLALGGRADAASVREGAREAEVEAVFDGRSLRRTVTREGRSRAWIDDESVSVSELRETAAGLVDVHGPAASLRLQEEPCQREILDAFSGLPADDAKCVRYREAWDAFRAAGGRLAELESSDGADPDAIDLLRFQVQELESAALCEEDETVAERHAAAARAGDAVECAGAVTEILGGDSGVCALIGSLQPRLAALARHVPQAEEWLAGVEELSQRAGDLSRAVADAAAELGASGEALEALDARLTLVNRLKRKYLKSGAAQSGGDVAALLAVLDAKRARLDALEHREERIAEAKRDLAEAEKNVRKAGAALSKVRKAGAKKLAAAVTGELRGLGFDHAELSVAVADAEPAEHGCDRVEFLFRPNPGEPERPLAEIASSGEIARVALAVKSAAPAGAAGAAQTLVFDEIDANVGGETGLAVGTRLRSLASHVQVVAITHLPQTAVFGDRHFVVRKTVGADGRTRSTVAAAEGADRISEVARMLGGENTTSVARRHAEELLGMASRIRR